MEKRSNAVTFAGNPVTVVGAELTVGQKAPDFSLTANDLSNKTLADYEGKVKVISVIPSIDTGVCDAQTRWFNQNITALGEDVVVLTVSVDLPFAQKRWCAASGIENVVTLSDYKTVEFGASYGFLIEELRLLSRGIVILDKENVVRYVEYVPEITTAVNFDATVTATKELL